QQKTFGNWLQAHGVKPGDVVPNGTDWSGVTFDVSTAAKQANPRLYYHYTLFAYDHGIVELKSRTETVKKYMPQAETGANYSPHGGAPYLGETHQWVTLFRRGGVR